MPRRAISKGALLPMAAPRKRISPDVSGSAPEMSAKVVLLPAPLGPMSPRISPLTISNERSLTATSPPNALRAFLTSSSGPSCAA